MKLLNLITTALTTCILSTNSQATCSVAGDYIHPIKFYYATEISIDASLPLYSTLGSFRIQSTIDAGARVIATCENNDAVLNFEPDRPYLGSGIYDTGIPGIGMKVLFVSGGDDTNFEGEAPITFLVPNSTIKLPYYLISYLTLVKTGHIPAGGQIPTGSIIKGNIVNYGNLLVWNDILERALVVNLSRSTCTVNTPNLTVNLGEVSISDFNAGGRTTPVNFNIDLNCEGGTRPADVYVTLTDANNPGNTSTQLGLSPDSDARGIALEVNNKFGAVTFGPDLNGTGNPGQWLDGAAGVGSYSIPLSVNYVRLGGPIKGGTANSGVTYTLNYD